MLYEKDTAAEDKYLLDEGFTTEDIAEMADSERAALLSDFGDNDEDDDVLDDDPDGSDDDEPDDLDAGADDDDPDNKKKIDDGAAAAAAAADAGKDKDDDVIDKNKEEVVQGKPVSKIENADITQLNNSLEAKQGELKDLQTKFKAGEIDIEDYMIAKDEVKDAITDIKVDIGKASAIQTVNDHNQATDWQTTQRAFSTKPENKMLFDNEVMFDALQTQIDKIQSSKEGYKSYDDLLHRAAEKVKSAFNVPKTEGKGGKKRENPPKPGEDDMTVNLHKVPAAAKSEGGGKFDHLEGLNGLELEAATSKMSPEMQDEWARSN